MYKPGIESNLKKKASQTVQERQETLWDSNEKIEEILQNPHHYKPLSYDMKQLRRVHIGSTFVFVFSIDENNGIVLFLDMSHHDKIYGSQKDWDSFLSCY